MCFFEFYRGISVCSISLQNKQMNKNPSKLISVPSLIILNASHYTDNHLIRFIAIIIIILES